jgi:hypothetical protein
MLNWVRLTYNIKFTELVELNGLDYTIYLVYLQHVFRFFAVLGIASIVFFVPLYLFGASHVELESG